MSQDIIGIYELLDAIQSVIKAADPEKRDALARTIDAYAKDFPDEFFWAVGPQAPMLLPDAVGNRRRVPAEGAVGAAGDPADGPQAGGQWVETGAHLCPQRGGRW